MTYTKFIINIKKGKRCETGESKSFLRKTGIKKKITSPKTDKTSIQIHETSMSKSHKQAEHKKTERRPENKIVKDLASCDDLNSNVSFSSDNKLEVRRGDPKNIIKNNIPKSNRKKRSV